VVDNGNVVSIDNNIAPGRSQSFTNDESVRLEVLPSIQMSMVRHHDLMPLRQALDPTGAV